MAKKTLMAGEVGVAAETNGKRITLDPIKKFPIEIELREVESTIPCGFRQPWINAENDGKKIDMHAGAGCGSKWLTISYGDRDFCIDMYQVLNKIINTIDAESST